MELNFIRVQRTGENIWPKWRNSDVQALAGHLPASVHSFSSNPVLKIVCLQHLSNIITVYLTMVKQARAIVHRTHSLRSTNVESEINFFKSIFDTTRLFSDFLLIRKILITMRRF